MGSLSKILAQMRSAPQNVRYTDLAAVCEHYFGKPHQQGTSHGESSRAKPYQVRQFLAAVRRLEGARQ